MKRHTCLNPAIVWMSMAVSGLLAGSASGQVGSPVGTAITYQGRLELDGVPVDSPGCDFSFSLWNHPSNPFQQIGPTLVFDGQGDNPPPVPVSNGLFTVELDFGSDAFFDDPFFPNDRWLEIAVTCPSGGALTTLSPRQPLTAAPFALQARGLSVDDSRRLGVGTVANDLGQLSVRSNAERAGFFMREDDSPSGVREVLDITALVTGTTQPLPGLGSRLTWRLEAPNFGMAQAGYIDVVWDDPDASRTHMRFGTANGTASTERMRITPEGRVGIGTTDPQQMLHVQDGNAGVAPNGNARIVLEHDATNLINLLTPSTATSGIAFGNPQDGNSAGGIYYNSSTPHGLQFRTAGNLTRMVIDGSGQVGIGTTAPAADLHVRGTDTLGSVLITPSVTNSHSQVFFSEQQSTSFGMILRYEGGANQLQVIGQQSGVETDPLLIVQRSSAGRVGLGTTSPTEKLHVVGNIRATGSVFASCGTLSCSDTRYKTHVRPVEHALAVVEKLRPVRFNWKREAFPDHQFSEDDQIGLIAQETRVVLPEVVHEGRDGYLSVDYGRLTPVLVEALSELRAEKDAQMATLRAERDWQLAEKKMPGSPN